MAAIQEHRDKAGFRTSLHEYPFMALTVIAIGLCVAMSVPFIPPLVWAFSFAVLVAPLHARLEKKIGRPGLAATLSTIGIALIVIGPLVFVGGKLIGEGRRLVELVKKSVESGEWRRALDEHEQLRPIRPWIENNIDVGAVVNNIGSWLTEIAAAFVAGSFMQILSVVIMFYLLFYFLRDREEALRMLRGYIPLKKSETDRLFKRVEDTIYATVYGTIAVAAIQGTLGGLMFWWLGLPAPILWGTIMALLAIVPVLGAFFIWIPAAAYLLLDGSIVKAIILTVWGSVVIGGIDNVLYPILVGDRLKLHTIPAFIAIVGGLGIFGASGLILGPVTLTITIELLEIWRRRTSERPAS